MVNLGQGRGWRPGSRGKVAWLPLIAFVISLASSAHTQTFTVLHTFHEDEGLFSAGQLTLDAEGNIYGGAGGGKEICGTPKCGALFKMNGAGKLLGVYSFNGLDGDDPVSGIVLAGSKVGFGVTTFGGVNSSACSVDSNPLCGLVYKMNAAGKETVLHYFTNSPDGDSPDGRLIEDSSGNLYGTTVYGGLGYGIVFKLDQSGNENILYTFTGKADGANPYVGVTQDSANDLYGTTGYGGDTGCGSQPGQGCGTVYELDSTGKESVLYSFEWSSDGAFPSSALMQDSAGDLYGETQAGGNEQIYECDGYEGCGVVYELSPNGNGGWTEHVLYAFNNTDGYRPFGGLVRDAAGNFYGVTLFGGEQGCNGVTCGVVFKLDTSGNETVLHEFTGGSDGAWPNGGLAMDADGNLYGTTQNGGDSNCVYDSDEGCGVVFKISF